MEIHKRSSPQVQCAEQKVSQYTKPTLSKGVGGSKRWGGTSGKFLKYWYLQMHTGLNSSLCRSESHLCLGNKTTLQLTVSLLGTKANHCPSPGLCKTADLHQHDWAKSSHHPSLTEVLSQGYHFTALAMFKV